MQREHPQNMWQLRMGTGNGPYPPPTDEEIEETLRALGLNGEPITIREEPVRPYQDR
jgi:hypothetical protein